MCIRDRSTDIAMGVNKALEAREKTMTEDELDAIGAGDQEMCIRDRTDIGPLCR